MDFSLFQFFSLSDASPASTTFEFEGGGGEHLLLISKKTLGQYKASKKVKHNWFSGYYYKKIINIFI